MKEPTKLPRKKVQELYGISRSKLIQLENEVPLTKYYLGSARKMPYYDIQEIEKAFQTEK